VQYAAACLDEPCTSIRQPAAYITWLEPRGTLALPYLPDYPHRFVLSRVSERNAILKTKLFLQLHPLFTDLRNCKRAANRWRWETTSQWKCLLELFDRKIARRPFEVSNLRFCESDTPCRA
jgi:hypothetical protein